MDTSSFKYTLSVQKCQPLTAMLLSEVVHKTERLRTTESLSQVMRGFQIQIASLSHHWLVLLHDRRSDGRAE